MGATPHVGAMAEPDAAVDISTVRLTGRFPALDEFSGGFAALATLLGPAGVRVTVALPGGGVRQATTSGQSLLWCYAGLAAGESVPWCLGGGLAETDGDRARAPGSPPLVGSLADFRRTLGTLVAALFGGLEAAGADPVPAVETCLGPGVDIDVRAVHDRVRGRA